MYLSGALLTTVCAIEPASDHRTTFSPLCVALTWSVCVLAASHQYVCGARAHVPSTRTHRPVGTVSTVAWYCVPNVAVYWAWSKTVTVCACAPPSDHERNPFRMPAAACGDGTSSVWSVPSAHQKEAGATTTVPSSVTARLAGVVSNVCRYSVANVAG